MGFAPIGLFAYNRPEHLARALGALARCPELASSSLTIFCDGAKPNATAETRENITDTSRGPRVLCPEARIACAPAGLGTLLARLRGRVRLRARRLPRPA